MPIIRKDIEIPSDDSAKAARILARSFYKELRKNGFGDQQIIQVASELISCLNRSLEGFKKKVHYEEEQ
jgi:glycosylphosphatidylinositol transamidase (GPIT) subunit GPI8